MTLTILLSTHNGEKVLPFVLNGYAKQTRSCTWDMVIVNNGSNHETSECLQKYLDLLPLTIVDHPKPGKNGALNAALPHVKGSFIIVTDDDAIPDTDFIEQWEQVASNKIDFDLFGGRIEPLFQAPPPSWMLSSRFHFQEIFAACDYPEGPINASHIFGPNMAIRRAILDAGITFNEAIGPDGSNMNYPMGSETEFCTRVEGLGFKSFFAAGPRVHHIVRPHQTHPSFWSSRAYRHGLGVGMRERLEKGEHILPIGTRLTNMVTGRLRQGKGYLVNKLSPADTFDAHEGLWNYHWHRGYTDAKVQARI